LRQSSIIFGALFAAFIVYITVRGELPKYLQALFPKSGGSAPAGTGSIAGSLPSIGQGIGGVTGTIDAVGNGGP